MHLTIIGGSGFVGKSFIDSFNQGFLKKYSIIKLTIICRNKIIIPKSKYLNLKKIKIIYGDIQKIKKLPKSDLFIYAAETTNTSKYNKIQNNHKKAINNFCKLVKDFKESKILYISSGSVLKKNFSYNRDTLYKKIYSKLKLYSESRIKSLSKFKIKTSIARCFTFIGRWLPTDQHYVLGNFINDAQYKNEITIRSKNLVYRSYMYADDMVIWLVKILINSKKSCKTYNVGSDRKIEIKKLATLVSGMFNKKIKIKTNKLQLNYIDKYIPDIRKTKNHLNLKINYNLTKSLQLTINKMYNEKKN
jgi:nucleoside-diphosphate-sugar epimerase|tara:strand:- start:461 stop:1372 length:912 start_codon:yes stop_codon:yes gene_type:complete